ncbi:MAG: GNAT family N-acetyltransferase [Anaerolineales bacterium]|nr:MAG: GNAT family N-acetyltransferase [Anaerolineales bacterium]
MSELEIRPMRTPQEKNIFLTFPWRIYAGDTLWVPPLLPERRKTIDPQRGVFFQRGEAEFFIAWRGRQPVGTICCAEDKASHQAHPWKDALIGFFECLEDYTIARLLFDHAVEWASRRGLHALYGPFNLDYEDSYGVLIDGRNRPPAIFCGHTPEYYQRFFERYGFQPGRGQNLAYAIDVDLTTPEARRMSRLAERIRQRGRFQIRSANLDYWEDEIERVYQLINRALAHLPGHIPWQREALEALLTPFRNIIDPDLVLFAETAQGETVGWFPGLPNLNETLIRVNGLRYPWNYLQLLWHSRRQPECLSIKSVLVPPEYWDTGVAVLLFDEMGRRASARGYKWLDLSLTSDDNPRTPILAEHMGARVYKRYQIYRKWLNHPPEVINP